MADDVFEVYGVAPDPGRTRAGLFAAVREAVEPAGRDEAFAVSASFVGTRNFNRYDVEDLVGERLGGRYFSRRGGSVPPADRTEWRVVLDGKTLWIARRPYAVPLHRRAWRRRTVQGSLHPPVAAAMAQLAELEPGHDVLDPFCGAGTILLEAHLFEPGAQYVGVDRDPDAIAAATANATALHNRREVGDGRGVGVRWLVGEAGRGGGMVDRVVTNPPWGVRLGVGDLASWARRWRERLRPGGLLVAILMPEQVEQLGRGWRVQARYDVAVAGQHPVIVVAQPSATIGYGET
ncbi:TRM11 family SAM-dependent methyltransferase [Kribbella sp. NPDC048928]|uniref:TRM11 family SAM-dependent methyltransferase n=1 Tax=Kribbella sp. NPDC048928 TaxID=3364111 RepID=UPI0037102685